MASARHFLIRCRRRALAQRGSKRSACYGLAVQGRGTLCLEVVRWRWRLIGGPKVERMLAIVELDPQ